MADNISNLVLYTDNRLPNPQRVLLTVAELGIDLKAIDLDISKREHMTRYYTTLSNGFNEVPLLTTRDPEINFTLLESRAISRFLCLLHPSPLLPPTSDFFATAKFEEAASLEVAVWDHLANRLTYEAYFTPLMGRLMDEGLVRELKGALHLVLDGIERQFEDGRKFMAGDDFTLVDVFYLPYMLKLSGLYYEEMFGQRAGLRGWWDRIIMRPSVRLSVTYHM